MTEGAGLELEGPTQPAGEDARQRVVFADVPFARRADELRQGLRELVGAEAPAVEQGQGDDADGGDVATGVALDRIGGWRRGDAIALPRVGARQLELIDRGAEGGIGDDDPRRRHDPEPLGREGPEGVVLAVPGEQCHRGQQLAQQRDHRLDRRPQVGLLRRVEEVGQPPAAGRLGNDDQPIDRRPVDAQDAHVRGVAHGGEPRHALGQCLGKAGVQHQLRRQFELLDRLAGGRVGRRGAAPKSISHARIRCLGAAPF